MERWKLLGRALLVALVIALLAPVKFYMSAVPLTLHTLVIFSIAAMLHWRLACLGVAMYLLAGALGLPVFAGYQSGWEKLVGSTAGFLWGFLLVGGILSRWAQAREAHFFNAMVWLFFAHFLLFIPGFAVLYWQEENLNTWLTFVGLIPGLLIKSIVGGILVAYLKPKLPPQWTGVR